MTPDKKVKILATLGPATDGIDDIRERVEAGVNIFRLNFSHGDHAEPVPTGPKPCSTVSARFSCSASHCVACWAC